MSARSTAFAIATTSAIPPFIQPAIEGLDLPGSQYRSDPFTLFPANALKSRTSLLEKRVVLDLGVLQDFTHLNGLIFGQIQSFSDALLEVLYPAFFHAKWI